MNTAFLINKLYNEYFEKEYEKKMDPTLKELLSTIEDECGHILNNVINNRETFRKDTFNTNNMSFSKFEKNKRIEYRENNRYFKDLCTDIVNNSILDQSEMYNFMYIIWKCHFYTLSLYRTKFNIDINEIIFIYKGGNFLAQLAKTFWTSLPGDAVSYFIRNYRKYFKLSDMDYAIYINPNLENYTQIFDDINHLSFKIQQLIRKILAKNKVICFKYFKATPKYKSFVLDNWYNKMLIDDNAPWKDIENTSYFGDEVVDLTFYDSSAKRDDSEQVYFQRNDQIIKEDNNGNTIRSDIKTENVNFMYISFNEALSFVDHDNFSHFNLIRTKINFNIKIKHATTGKIRSEHIGGELLDVSIPHRDDSNVAHFFDNVKNNITTINYQQPCHISFNILNKNECSNFNQRTYSILYVYYDLYRMLFVNNYYPWLDRKYLKRIFRLFYVSNIDFFSTNVIRDENQVSIKKQKFKNITYYINQYKKYIYDEKDSLYNIFKYTNIENKKKELKFIINKLSKLLTKYNDILCYEYYQNKFIIRTLRASLDIIIKVLYGYNCINFKIYKPKETYKLSNDNILNCLDNLKEFIINVTKNLTITIQTMEKIEEFCNKKTIDENILYKYEFPWV